ncbi:hypothetical protein GCM10010831_01100 [Psychroflexus salis]|uniref:Uncharacterized protein n=2 Tax=Psychroflexus salis TaxID=1526574 RepID=A0A917E664_9FLAO|nr:hypothetical protein GCM10010831_01100 [Psychroflexus salis]
MVLCIELNAMKIKSFLKLLIGVILLLFIPLIGMQLSNEVNWSLFDFIVAAFLLLISGSLIWLIINKAKTKKTKFLFVGFVLFLLIIVWAELAVGLFGNPFAGS